MPELASFLDYGALGILVLVLFWTSRVIERQLAAFDKLIEALDRLKDQVNIQETHRVSAHHELLKSDAASREEIIKEVRQSCDKILAALDKAA